MLGIEGTSGFEIRTPQQVKRTVVVLFEVSRFADDDPLVSTQVHQKRALRLKTCFQRCPRAGSVGQRMPYPKVAEAPTTPKTTG